jgi:hypothetical protein
VQETGGKEVPRARGVNHLPRGGGGWGVGGAGGKSCGKTAED